MGGVWIEYVGWAKWVGGWVRRRGWMDVRTSTMPATRAITTSSGVPRPKMPYRGWPVVCGGGGWVGRPSFHLQLGY